jgi:hypothetical protein
MRRGILCTLSLLSIGFTAGHARASDLTLSTGGRVSMELLFSDATFHNTISIVSPGVAVAATGCKLEPSDGLGGTRVLSEKTSQRGCRVDLDGDPSTPGLQPLPAGATIRFNLCAQTDADPACEFVWSSDPSQNSDGFDHLRITQLHPAEFPGKIYQLAWEDESNGGDQDFNDLIAVLRVDLDSDGDGLWDDWERFGIDTDADGVIDLDLPALGANPMHKDLFVEIDYMDCAVTGSDCPVGDSHSHRPKQAAITAAIQAFAAAPDTNPDGTTGVHLHVDVSNGIAHRNTVFIPGTGCPQGGAADGNFDTIKADAANFGPSNPRRFAFHYNLWAHQQPGGSTSSGCGELPGNDFIVTFGGWNLGTANANTGTVDQETGTVMHELGHNLNLQHGGTDGINNKPNYLSVMNYTFQLGGIIPSNRFDYSRTALATLNEASLDESNGLGGGADNTRYFCPNGTQRTGSGTGAIDWNCNAATDTSVSVDINGDASTGSLAGFDDWTNLRFDLQAVGDFEDGDHSHSAPTIEIDEPTARQLQNHAPTAHAGIDQIVECTGPGGATIKLDGSGSIDPDGDPLSYTWFGDFGILSGSVITAKLPLGTHQITLLVNDGNGPSGDSSATLTVTVRDTTTPQLSVTLSRTQLWPPNHKLIPIDAAIVATDACSAAPHVVLESITSNEPGNDDIQDATFGTDDRSFRLRAERLGRGDGRVYTITYRATDDSGNTTVQHREVRVPHDQGH